MHFIKRIVFDIFGYLLILMAILFGWLPFVGGIPLFLTGLKILSIHNSWAQKLFDYARKNLTRFANAFFKEHPLLIILYDATSFLFLLIGIKLLIIYDFYWVQVLASIILVIAISLLLGNKKRLQRLTNKHNKT